MTEGERRAGAPKFEGWYQAGSHGHMYGVDRRVHLVARGTSCTRLVRGQPLRPHRRHKGERWRVTLSRNGVRSDHDLADIVLEAFEGPPPEAGYHAQHLDGDLNNNNLTNLVWAAGRTKTMAAAA